MDLSENTAHNYAKFSSLFKVSQAPYGHFIFSTRNAFIVQFVYLKILFHTLFFVPRFLEMGHLSPLQNKSCFVIKSICLKCFYILDFGTSCCIIAHLMVYILLGGTMRDSICLLLKLLLLSRLADMVQWTQLDEKVNGCKHYHQVPEWANCRLAEQNASPLGPNSQSGCLQE